MERNGFVALQGLLVTIGELAGLFLGVSLALEWFLLFFPEKRIRNILKRRQSPLLGSLLGAVFGSLTPLCSYSSIPLAISFLRFGVPFEAVVSFLLVSPLLNPILASLLLALFGWKRTFLYILLIFSETTLLGYVLALAKAPSWVREDFVFFTPSPNACSEVSTLRPEVRRILQGVWDLTRKILPFLFLGSVLGTLLEFLVPQDVIFRVVAPQNPSAIFWVSLLGIPLYLKAEFVLPLGKALLDKGVNSGVVIAFLVSGAGGVSIPELSLLLSAFRPRFVAAFASWTFLLAVEMGLLFFYFIR